MLHLQLPSYIRQLSLVCLVMLAAVACRNKKVAPTHIPADVSGVVCLDFKHLSSKSVQWSDLLKPDFIRVLSNQDEADLVSQVINAGVNYQQPGYLFFKIAPQDRYFAGVFHLSSESQFEKLLNNNGSKWQIRTSGERKYAYLGDYAVVMWYQKQAWLLSTGVRVGEAALKSRVDKICQTKPEEALESKNAEFAALLQGTFDIAYWVDYSQLPTAAAPFMEGLSLPTFAQDALRLTQNATGKINFENGEVRSESRLVLQQAILDKYKDVIKTRLDPALVRALPMKKPLFMLGTGINPQGGLRLFKENARNTENVLETALSIVDIKVDDLAKALSGDMVIGIDHFNPSAFFTDSIDIGILLGVNDAVILNKLLDNLTGIPFVSFKKREKYYQLKTDDLQLFFVLKDQKLFITNGATYRDSFLKGDNQLDGMVSQLASGTLGVSFVNFGSIDSEILKQLPFQLPLDAGLLPALGTFDAKASLSGNVADISTRLIMKDKRRNALATLIEMLRKAQANRKPTL